MKNLREAVGHIVIMQMVVLAVYVDRWTSEA
jgi:hypothetical protein